MVKSDVMDTSAVKAWRFGSKSNWFWYTYKCKAAAQRFNVYLISVQLLFMYTCVSNVYVSGKKYFLFLRQCQVCQPVQSQSKKRSKIKVNWKKLFWNIKVGHWLLISLVYKCILLRILEQIYGSLGFQAFGYRNDPESEDWPGRRVADFWPVDWVFSQFVGR